MCIVVVHANPVDIPELTLFETDGNIESTESQLNLKEPAENNKFHSESDDIVDPMDENEFLVPQKHKRQRRTLVFRPKFAYDREVERAAEERIARAERRVDAQHHRAGHHGHGNGHHHAQQQHRREDRQHAGDVHHGKQQRHTVWDLA